MTAFSDDFEIADRSGERWQVVQGLVDKGSTYTWIPSRILESLGFTPEFTQEFQTADGRIVERQMAQVVVRLVGRTRYTLAVFADGIDSSLLGMVTLEGCGLGVDPVNERLIPVRGRAMHSGRSQG